MRNIYLLGVILAFYSQYAHATDTIKVHDVEYINPKTFFSLSEEERIDLTQNLAQDAKSHPENINAIVEQLERSRAGDNAEVILYSLGVLLKNQIGSTNDMSIKNNLSRTSAQCLVDAALLGHNNTLGHIREKAPRNYALFTNNTLADVDPVIKKLMCDIVEKYWIGKGIFWGKKKKSIKHKSKRRKSTQQD